MGLSNVNFAVCRVVTRGPPVLINVRGWLHTETHQHVIKHLNQTKQAFFQRHWQKIDFVGLPCLVWLYQGCWTAFAKVHIKSPSCLSIFHGLVLYLAPAPQWKRCLLFSRRFLSNISLAASALLLHTGESTKIKRGKVKNPFHQLVTWGTFKAVQRTHSLALHSPPLNSSNGVRSGKLRSCLKTQNFA